jgi:hypothetical protein
MKNKNYPYNTKFRKQKSLSELFFCEKQKNIAGMPV